MKKVLFSLLLLVVALAVIPLFLPKTMHVEDEYTYDVPINEVYSYFNDLTKFTQFDAWSAKDPDIQLEFSSPAIGENAFYKWHSEDANLGDGQMKIIETKANEFVLYELKFGTMSGNTAEVILQELEDDQTRVIWSFDSGEATYPFQVFNLLMKGTVENNLHKGLVNLDSLMQQNQNNRSLNNVLSNQIQIVTQKSYRLFGILQQTSTQNEEIGTAMAETFGMVNSYLQEVKGLTNSEIGNPIAFWKQYNQEADNALFYCGYFLESKVTLKDEFEYVDVDGGKYLTTIHQGSYELLSESYAKLAQYAQENEIILGTESYDVYLNSPDNTDTSKLKIQIYIPIIE